MSATVRSNRAPSASTKTGFLTRTSELDIPRSDVTPLERTVVLGDAQQVVGEVRRFGTVSLAELLILGHRQQLR